MATGRELAAAIGRSGACMTDIGTVSVRVLDARHVFGRLDYQVAPEAGSGAAWVSAERVQLAEEGR